MDNHPQRKELLQSGFPDPRLARESFFLLARNRKLVDATPNYNPRGEERG